MNLESHIAERKEKNHGYRKQKNKMEEHLQFRLNFG